MKKVLVGPGKRVSFSTVDGVPLSSDYWVKRAKIEIDSFGEHTSEGIRGNWGIYGITWQEFAIFGWKTTNR